MVIAVGFVLVVNIGYQLSFSKTENTSDVLFDITAGESVKDITMSLNEQGIYSNGLIFRIYLFQSGNYNKLQSGQYQISAGLTLSELVAMFAHGDVANDQVSVIEGWRLSQIETAIINARESSERGLFSSFDQSKFDFEYPKGFTGKNLEGLLFPDTYSFKKGATDSEIIEIMLETFKEKTQNYSLLKNDKGLSEYQVLILASIIEREVTDFEDRKRVASVYLNRLDAGMKLQADPTVQYAKSSDWSTITVEDYQSVGSSYNTYLNQGLPPTPISTPGLEAIRSVVEASKTGYYFFFSTPSGKTIFSKNLEDHNIAKNKYLYD
jgi:UPF0755 protein